MNEELQKSIKKLIKKISIYKDNNDRLKTLKLITTICKKILENVKDTKYRAIKLAILEKKFGKAYSSAILLLTTIIGFTVRDDLLELDVLDNQDEEKSQVQRLRMVRESASGQLVVLKERQAALAKAVEESKQRMAAFKKKKKETSKKSKDAFNQARKDKNAKKICASKANDLKFGSTTVVIRSKGG